VPDEVDLPFTVVPTTDLAVGAAIGGSIDRRGPGPQGHDHGGVEILGNGIQFDHVGDRLQSRDGQELGHRRYRPFDLLVTAAHILGAVDVGQEKGCRQSGTRTCEQVGVRAGKTACLPGAQTLAPLRRPDVRLGRDAQMDRTIQLGCQTLNDLFPVIHGRFIFRD